MKTAPLVFKRTVCGLVDTNGLENVSSFPSVPYQWDTPTLIAQGDSNTRTHTHTLILPQGYKGHTITAVTHTVLRHGSVNTDFHIKHYLLPTPTARAVSTNHLHAWMRFHMWCIVINADWFDLIRDEKHPPTHELYITAWIDRCICFFLISLKVWSLGWSWTLWKWNLASNKLLCLSSQL